MKRHNLYDHNWNKMYDEEKLETLREAILELEEKKISHE